MPNTQIQDLMTQWRQLHDGGNWVDECFKVKLEQLSLETAFLQPLAGVHSVAEILWHCTYWRVVQFKRLEGDRQYRDDTVETYNFLPLERLREMGWEKLQGRFAETRGQFEKLIGPQDDTYLDRSYDENINYRYLIDGLVQHDFYHLGQIGLVTKMLRVTGKLV